MGGVLIGLDLIRAEYGLAARVAEALGLYRSTVSQWRAIPAEYVATVARVTGYPACRLRPDLYPAKPVRPHADKRRKKAGGTKRGGRYGH